MKLKDWFSDYPPVNVLAAATTQCERDLLTGHRVLIGGEDERRALAHISPSGRVFEIFQGRVRILVRAGRTLEGAP